VNILFELFNFQAATAQFTTLPQDELEALLAMLRDRKEKDELIFKHIEQRLQLVMWPSAEGI